ncbi:MAG: MerR family transcriptional regulator [Acidobacteria bacterium]|nr:MerR family transcriptional regulator [Acidobacteriota bacterium]
MKNITLSVDEAVLAGARRYAVEHDSTVNALVREYLTRLASQSENARTARRKILQLSNKSQARIGDARWTRDDLHER